MVLSCIILLWVYWDFAKNTGIGFSDSDKTKVMGLRKYDEQINKCGLYHHFSVALFFMFAMLTPLIPFLSSLESFLIWYSTAVSYPTLILSPRFFLSFPPTLNIYFILNSFSLSGIFITSGFVRCVRFNPKPYSMPIWQSHLKINAYAFFLSLCKLQQPLVAYRLF